jgi:hypothetical protein
MRTPAPSMSRVFLVLLGSTALAAIAAAGACTNPDGITPTCDDNTEMGMTPDPNGCAQFATCTVNPDDPSACCVNADGGELTGSDLATCLYGYGGCPGLTMDALGNFSCTDGGPSGSGTGGGDGG